MLWILTGQSKTSNDTSFDEMRADASVALLPSVRAYETVVKSVNPASFK